MGKISNSDFPRNCHDLPDRTRKQKVFVSDVKAHSVVYPVINKLWSRSAGSGVYTEDHVATFTYHLPKKRIMSSFVFLVSVSVSRRVVTVSGLCGERRGLFSGVGADSFELHHFSRKRCAFE